MLHYPWCTCVSQRHYCFNHNNSQTFVQSWSTLVPPSLLQRDSVLPACSTTLKRLERPSVRPLRTGLSRVVVERAQAEPPPPPKVLWGMFQRLRSLEEEEDPSSREVEPKDRYEYLNHQETIEEKLWKCKIPSRKLPEETLRWSFGDPYLGEQHGRSMRLWTLSSDVEICRVRADTSEEVDTDEGRGDQVLVCNPDALLLGRLSVWSPMLTYWAAVCVDLVDMPTICVEKCMRQERLYNSGRKQLPKHWF